MESKEYLEKSRQSYINMVSRYNREIEEMEKTGMLDGQKVTKKDIEVSKEMRMLRLTRINEINTDLQKNYRGK